MTTGANLEIHCPNAYADGAPHEAFAALRAADPVHWVDLPAGRGFWALLTHADVDLASRRHDLFSSASGGVIIDDLAPEKLDQLRGMLLGMDPPRHRIMRKPLTPPFSARAIANLEERVRARTVEILDAVPDGETVDFVADLAGHLPTRVVGELMGLPREDWERLHHSAVAAARAGTDTTEEVAAETAAIAELGLYAFELASRRRSAPTAPDDLTTFILNADFGGNRITEVEFATMFVQIFTAANDTTVGMLSGGMHALLDHPDQLQLLRSDARLTASAVEEILRYANPLHYFRRTVTQDVELRGKQIRAGDRVALYYTSANRDETVFADPHRFDIARSPNRHIAFGIGEHYCLGVHLARLEGRLFFDELLGRFRVVEPAGPAIRKISNFNNGLDRLPIRLTR